MSAPLASSSTARPARLHSLDLLRAIVMLIGIIFHIAEASQNVRGAARSPTVDILLNISRAWRMPIFFMLSGFFSELLLHRDGAWTAWSNRLRRIGIPLLLALFTLLPLNWYFQLAYEEVANAAVSPWSFDFFVTSVAHRLRKPRLHHIWFLYYLVIFSAIWYGSRSRPSWRAFQDRLERWFAFAAVLLFALCLTLKLAPGYRGRTDALIIQPIEFFYYFAFFMLGGFSFRSFRERGRLPLPSWRWSLPITIASGIAVFTIGGVIAKAVFVLSGAFAVISLFNDFFDRPLRPVAFLVAASYWTYLFHEPLLHAIGAVLGTSHWPLVAEVLVVSTLTYAICFLTFAYLVRGTWLDRLLNGGARARGSGPR